MKTKNNEKLKKNDTPDTDDEKQTENTEAENDNVSDTEEDASENYVQPEEAEKEPSKEEEYLALAQRIQADFDNYRKRNASVRADALADGKVEAVKAFLPIMDNLERALETEKKNGASGSLMDGLEMILKQMSQMLTGLGVEEVEAEGKPFDPACHNAVMQVPAGDGVEKGVVAAVFAKGYKMGDKIIRYSMVQVTV